MNYSIFCSKCGKEREEKTQWRCICGAPFDIALNIKFDKEKIIRSCKSIWRYKHYFPYVKRDKIITLGEGCTPITKLDDNLWIKLDYLMPTGSYKDRGSSTLVSSLCSESDIIKGLSEDSSGNAGASLAAYCARANIKLKVFVPKSTSGPKLSQIKAYGAEVFRVEGTREDVSKMAQRAMKDHLYVGHVWHPFFRDGIRTLLYEVAEQTGWRMFDKIYVPVSAGTLLLGVISGIKHLLSSDIINKVPRIIAVQTRQVSPLYHRMEKLSYVPPESIKTVADALVSTNPPLLDLMEKNLREVDGGSEVVDEEEIVSSYYALAKKGFHVEPSSAVTYAAYLKQLAKGGFSEKEKVLLILTGTGLKSPMKSFRNNKVLL
ncbi:MAG: pyridoxal-phosphate dependent enzyme [Nitrososphaeria archaeon]